MAGVSRLDEINRGFEKVVQAVVEAGPNKVSPDLIESMLLEFVYRSCWTLTDLVADELKDDDCPLPYATKMAITGRLQEAWHDLENGPEITNKTTLREVLTSFLKIASTNSQVENYLMLTQPKETFVRTAAVFADMLDFLESRPALKEIAES